MYVARRFSEGGGVLFSSLLRVSTLLRDREGEREFLRITVSLFLLSLCAFHLRISTLIARYCSTVER